MADFNQCINDLEFLDPPLSGGSYTWRRGQNHSCATRIDRFLFSSQWVESFSKISQSVLPQLGSDHNPILLSCGDWKHRKSYFKFENWWLKEEGFIDKVKEWWSSFNATGRPDSQLASKLSQLKVKLKEWSKANKNNWKERKDLILSQEIQLVLEFEEVSRNEEITPRQRSREQWIKNGDKNTEYFHRMANAHRRFNSIDILKVEGAEVTRSLRIGDLISHSNGTPRSPLKNRSGWKDYLKRMKY
ncbi:hypothetical protein MTR67_015987 [Solanum verrucosum]|uniref:Uncharacterized protein n=1 Tax=Solanum verrucosum TaxID=315347 RepID=A0AAF0QF19_SOLVR|nr:hypothetical protein MTR67_015987 [Solanum verrucosum]